MSELNNSFENPELNTAPREVSEPEPVKASEMDKEKLSPREDGSPERKKETGNNTGETDAPEHPKLDVSEKPDRTDTRGSELHEQESPEHEKLRPVETAPADRPEQPEKTEKPEFEMPERTGDRIDMPRASDLSDDFLDHVPKDRRDTVDLAYRNAPPEIVSALNDHTSDLKPVEDTGYSPDEFGRPVKDGCYYSPLHHQVRMDERMDNDEYADVLPHEMSHYLDHERGWESQSPEFRDAMEADLAAMDRDTPEGRMKFNEMLDDAFNNGAALDRNVSDIMHGMFNNDPEILDRFNKEGLAGSEYSHWDNYWDSPGAREKETYANMGATLCSDNAVSNHFLERYYPNTYNQFKDFYGIE